MIGNIEYIRQKLKIPDDADSFLPSTAVMNDSSEAVLLGWSEI